ncbi:glycosyltransferase family 4 protein [Hymenobacter sp. B81]|uniref:glycosyltransferase family 4 protein n=1 Tax=Hymenobacter sp. B81 TaxID=3344878 RepID=UPI0037DC256D
MPYPFPSEPAASVPRQTANARRILVAIEDLRTGGAQIFAMRLTQALHERGHQVYLYTHYAHHVNHELLRQLAPDVQVVAYEPAVPGLDWLLRKTDGFLRRFQRPPLVREPFVERHLRRTLRELNVDVINSHMVKSDYVAARALGPRPRLPLVITMHGCYELFLHKHDEPEVTVKSRYALRQADAVIYLAEKNLEIFGEQDVRPLTSLVHEKVYSGLESSFSADKPRCTRERLGIGAHDFVFGMVARGIPEKGWQQALDSFQQLSVEFPQAHLVLVGQSEYLDELRRQVSNPHVHFTGFSSNPVDWIDLFDVGLLPSYFHAESLPNSVTEYLSCGKPTIATRIGEVASMLESPAGLAGMLLEAGLDWHRTDPGQLTRAMRAYLADAALLEEHRHRAQLAFDKFRMERCIAAYEQIFDRATAAAVRA